MESNVYFSESPASSEARACCEGVIFLEYSMTILEKDYSELQDHLFSTRSEQAAFLLCRLSITTNEVRFLVRSIIPVTPNFIIQNCDDHISYSTDIILPVLHTMRQNDESLFFVHSHPSDISHFSKEDDRSDAEMHDFIQRRLNRGIHGSLVFTRNGQFQGRIWDPETKSFISMPKIRVIGDSFKLHFSSDMDLTPIDERVFVKNILAFGSNMQTILKNIHVGVVGCGGTGSSLVEQLGRMGVGKLTLVDHDHVDSTSITRMHGSKKSDISKAKVQVMKEMLDEINLGTEVIPVDQKLDNATTAKALRSCDVIFSCLDETHFTRMILNSLCIYYYIPLIDMGIKFDSRQGIINDIYGRIDVVTPNNSCLLCRDVVMPEFCAAELMGSDEYQRLKAEGYAPELKHDQVQTISYNTLISSLAINEFINLITNFKKKSTPHSIYMFIAEKTTSAGIICDNKRPACICYDPKSLGAGDTDPFLGISW